MPGDGVTRPDGTWLVVPVAPGSLYESARWLPGAEVFQWVDILQARLYRWDPYGENLPEERQLDLEFLTVALPLSDDVSLVASRSSLHEYHWSSGDLVTVGSWTFGPEVRFNDGAVSPSGEVYIGSMSMARKPHDAHLYRLADRQLVPVLDRIGISNGLAWAPGAAHAYYVDSLVTRIHVLDLDGPTPELRVFAELDTGDEPDGLAVSPQGQVFAAMWGSAAVARFDPNGVRLADLPVAADFPTSVAIGGRDAELLLVTTAGEGAAPIAGREHDGRVLLGEIRYA